MKNEKRKKVLYFDCIGGISGDMVLGAFFHLGLNFEKIKKSLKEIGAGDFNLNLKKVLRNGISGIILDLQIKEDKERSFFEIKEIFEKSSLPQKVKDFSILAFENLRSAEAKVHGCSLNEVHFHEISSLDTMLDIAGCMLCMEEIGWPECFVSPLPAGRGFVQSKHGKLPLPAPATLKLLEGFDVVPSEFEKELVTPTGAAIVKTLCKGMKEIPQMKIISSGYGFGTMEIKNHLNALRIIQGEIEDRKFEDDEIVIEFSIDDMNPQLFFNFTQKIISCGANDIFLTPIIMKKQRPGVNVSIICEKNKLDKITDIIFNETTTIGLRYIPVSRIKLQCKIEKFKSSFGFVNVKISSFGGEIKNISPEYEDCLKIAKKKKLPLKKVFEIIYSEAINFYRK